MTELVADFFKVETTSETPAGSRCQLAAMECQEKRRRTLLLQLIAQDWAGCVFGAPAVSSSWQESLCLCYQTSETMDPKGSEFPQGSHAEERKGLKP